MRASDTILAMSVSLLIGCVAYREDRGEEFSAPDGSRDEDTRAGESGDSGHDGRRSDDREPTFPSTEAVNPDGEPDAGDAASTARHAVDAGVDVEPNDTGVVDAAGEPAVCLPEELTPEGMPLDYPNGRGVGCETDPVTGQLTMTIPANLSYAACEFLHDVDLTAFNHRTMQNEEGQREDYVPGSGCIVMDYCKIGDLTGSLSFYYGPDFDNEDHPPRREPNPGHVLRYPPRKGVTLSMSEAERCDAPKRVALKPPMFAWDRRHRACYEGDPANTPDNAICLADDFRDSKLTLVTEDEQSETVVFIVKSISLQGDGCPLCEEAVCDVMSIQGQPCEFTTSDGATVCRGRLVCQGRHTVCEADSCEAVDAGEGGD